MAKPTPEEKRRDELIDELGQVSMQKNKLLLMLFWMILLAWTIVLVICLTVAEQKNGRIEFSPLAIIFFEGAIATYRPLTILNGLLLILELFSAIRPCKYVSVFRPFLRTHLSFLLVIFFLLSIYYSFNLCQLFLDLYRIWFLWAFLTAF